MVITCEECSTKFNLDESLLKKEGSKVRCCRCRHVFTAFPSPAPIPLEDAPPQSNDDSTLSTLDDPDELTLDDELDLDLSVDPDELTLDNELDLDLSVDPDELTLDNELDLGFSVDSDELTLDDELDSTMDSEQPLPEKGFDLDDSMDNDDFFLDDGLELDQSQDQNQDQATNSDEANPDEELTFDFDSDDPGISLDGEIEFDDELELELEDYEDLDLSDPDAPSRDKIGESDPDLDSDLDFDFDLELELETDDQEALPDTGLEIDDAQETLPDAGLEIDNDQEALPDADLEIDDAQEASEMEFDLEIDILEPDHDTLTPVETELDEEINLSEFDEVLESNGDDLEKENLEPPAKEISPDMFDADESFDEDFLIREEEDKPDSEKEGDPTLLAGEKEITETAIAPPPLDYGVQDEFKKPVKIGKPIIIILLLAILLLAAYSASIFYGIKIPYLSNVNVPFLSDILRPPPPAPVPINLSPDKKSVNGRFITNTTAGTLFVITGSVTNTSKEICSHIKVKGSLITRDKVKAKNKTVFCGNLINEDQLKTVEMNQINSLLARETGNNQSNVNIQPGRSVPFMVVFSDLPENLENFTVNVEKFDRETQKR